MRLGAHLWLLFLATLFPKYKISSLYSEILAGNTKIRKNPAKRYLDSDQSID